MAAAVFGREEELDAIDAFLAQVRLGPAVLVLSGEPGIGKTILHDAGVARAAVEFDRVLSVRAVEAEARFSFAAQQLFVSDTEP
jgi:predicted ATPase